MRIRTDGAAGSGCDGGRAATAGRGGAPWTVLDVVAWIARDLGRRGVSSPRLDAELLVAHALGTNRVGLYLRHDAPLTEAERSAVREVLRRRRAGEPVAYILGRREFWGLDLRVDRRVLVPRPETELLVEEALAALADEGAPWSVVDVGTGSGAVALAVARHRPASRIAALDVSAEALDVARENATRLGLADRVDLWEAEGSAWLAGRPASFDAILANLPYVATAEFPRLQVEVREWEPRGALDGGPDGLRELRRVVPAAATALRPGGFLGLEIGADQGEAVVALCGAAGLIGAAVRRDYAGLSRVVTARRAS